MTIRSVTNIQDKIQARQQQQTKEALQAKFQEHFPLITNRVLVNRFERLCKFDPNAARKMFDRVEKIKADHPNVPNFNRFPWQFEYFTSSLFWAVSGVLADVEVVLNDLEKNPQVDPRSLLLLTKKKLTALNGMLQDNPNYSNVGAVEPRYTFSCKYGENTTVIDQVYLKEETLMIVGVVVIDCSDGGAHRCELNVDPVMLKKETYSETCTFWFCRTILDIGLIDGDRVAIHGAIEYVPDTDLVITRASSDRPASVTVESLIVERVSTPTV